MSFEMSTAELGEYGLQPKKLVLVSGKGGVGKSFLSIGIDSYLRRKGVPFAAVDADLSNCTFSRRSDKALQLDAYDAADVASRLQEVIERVLIKEGTPYLVVDTGAGSERPIRQWLHNERVINLLEGVGVSTYVITVVSTALDCVTPLIENVQLLPDARHIVAMNFGGLKRDPKDEFRPLETLTEFQDAAKGLPRIVIPKLDDNHKIDELDLALHEVGKWRKEIGFFLSHRAAAWMSNMEKQLGGIFDERAGSAY